MNRAWIPAGALAGVSVAGLIALGPLTSSLGTHVPFPPPVTISATQTPQKYVPVNYSREESVGNIEHAALNVKGGRAAGQSGDVGRVALQIKKPAPQTSRATTPPPPPATARPTKKAAKRQATIGAVSGPNGDQGLAGSNPNGSTHRGDLQSTPGSDTP
jgi:hypothetical protein